MSCKCEILALALLLLGITPARAQVDHVEPSTSLALRAAASALWGEGEDELTIITVENCALPLTGRTITRAKVRLGSSEELLKISIDESGAIVDEAALSAAERNARARRYGTLDPDLALELAALADGDTLRVAVWLRAPRLQGPARPPVSNGIEGAPSTGLTDPAAARAAANALRREAADMLSAQMPLVQAPFLAALEQLGLEPSYVSPVAPLVYVTASKAQIIELAARPDVDAVYGPHENHDLLATAKPTHKADVVDNWGIQGNGATVAILEDSRVQFLNPNLIAGVTRVPLDPNVDAHATRCAGIVASQNAALQGLAQNAVLVSANATTYDDDDLAAAIDWAAATQNVDVINNSWGFSDSQDLNEHDRHLDFVVRYLFSSATCAAGNTGGTCETGDERVHNPGKAFNVITCGGFNDGGTVTWDDDALYSCSSWLDPSTGAEKPEVVASAVGISSTIDVFPWTGGGLSGTSFAAPIVAAELACVMDSLNSFAYPETYKAIIMATAIHNIDFAEFDGVGGVDFRAAVQLAVDGTHDWRTVSPAEMPYTINRSCEAGEVVRAVVCWDSNPNGMYTTDPLETDIDLFVYQPGGVVLQTSSTSFANPYEKVEFIAPSTGVYQFRVSDTSSVAAEEFVALAVWTSNKVLTPDVARILPEPPIVEHNLRLDSALFWNAAALRPNTANYNLALYSDSAWLDPADYTELTASIYIVAGDVDFVVIDRNHAPAGDYYLAATEVSGAGNYTIEHGAHIADLQQGTYGPYAMAVGEVLKMYDVIVSAGVPKYIAAVPDSGDADLGLYLYDSDPVSSATWYQSRGDYLEFANAGGAGAAECLNASVAATDWLGLVVANFGATQATPFMLYVDTSAPTGSLAINGGAAQTGLSRVILNFNIADAQTGLNRMRIRNVPGAFGGWMPFAASGEWVLAAGTGLRTVEVEVENNACMTALFSDSITVYACPGASPALANGSFSDATGYPWCFTDQSDDGFVEYSGGAAHVRGGDDGSMALTYTEITQQVTLAAGFYDLTFDWSYTSGNSPDFDGAYFDLVNAATGATVIGGPQSLATQSGASGSEVQPFLSPPAAGITVEVRLGVFSVDNQFGPGFATFDNVVIAPQACAAVENLACQTQDGIAFLQWDNAGIYSSILVRRDGVLIATLPPAVESHTDFGAPAGAHTYGVAPVCPPGVEALQATCLLQVACMPVTGLVCSVTSGGDVALSWANGDSYASIEVRRDGVAIAALGGGATAYTDVGPSAGAHTYEVAASCGPGLPATPVTCGVVVPCLGVGVLSCTASGGGFQLNWTTGDAYAQIRVLRGAVLIATLPGGATSYFDAAPPAGSHTYQVIGDCAIGVSAPAAACTVSAACDSVSALNCAVAGDDVALIWALGDTYTQIVVTRDGALIATLGGGATAYTDVAPAAGAHVYGVRGDCAAGLESTLVSCAVTVPCLAVTGLTCAIAGFDAVLSWQIGDAYASITVERDGVAIAALGAAATDYTDPSVPAGMHTYRVIGSCALGAAAPAATCALDVDCNPVGGLACSVAGADVSLSWTLASAYTGIAVYRDGVVIAVLGAGATEYLDAGVAAGPHSYVVEAACGGGSVASSACLVDVGGGVGPDFLRGDCNLSAAFDIADAVFGLNSLFVPGAPQPSCDDACDANDDGLLNIADMIYLLNALFVPGSPQPVAPAGACGVDPTADALDCVVGGACP